MWEVGGMYLESQTENKESSEEEWGRGGVEVLFLLLVLYKPRMQLGRIWPPITHASSDSSQ